MVDLNKLLHPEDRELMEGQTGVSWVPKEPREVLLPYMSDITPEEDRKSVESRRKKAKEVMDGYSKIIAKCASTRAEIEQRCKNVTVKINSSQHLNVIEAIGRLFGIETNEITFEMYKQCIEILAQMSAENVPTLGGK
jgi:hypothetical protein